VKNVPTVHTFHCSFQIKLTRDDSLRFQIFKKLYRDRGQILSYNKPYISGKLIYLAFCIHLNLNLFYPCDWFCGPGSHINNALFCYP